MLSACVSTPLVGDPGPLPRAAVSALTQSFWEDVFSFFLAVGTSRDTPGSGLAESEVRSTRHFVRDARLFSRKVSISLPPWAMGEGSVLGALSSAALGLLTVTEPGACECHLVLSWLPLEPPDDRWC